MQKTGYYVSEGGVKSPRHTLIFLDFIQRLLDIIQDILGILDTH